MGLEVDEVVPGELDVTLDSGRRVRVLVPAGVGLPGREDDELALGLVLELLARQTEVPDVLDVSAALRTDPSLLPAVAARLDAADGPEL